MIITEIVYMGHQVLTICDGKCEKAWGISDRPRHVLDEDDPDNFEYLSDTELGEAPLDPGTYEGGEAKPFHPTQHNKWCVRACERCVMLEVADIGLHNWDKRVGNCG